MKPKIYALGKIWKSEANGQVYHGGGFVRLCAVELTTGCNRRL